MKKIVLISRRGRVDAWLMSMLNRLFPECTVEIAPQPALDPEQKENFQQRPPRQKKADPFADRYSPIKRGAR